MSFGLGAADVDGIAYGIAKIFHTPIDQLRSEAAAHRACFGGPPLDLSASNRKVSDTAHAAYNDLQFGEQMMNTPVGVDMFERYRHVAIDAVSDVGRQSPVLGYLRLGQQQHIYLFPAILDARAWFDQRRQIASGYDYMAVFLARDLRRPLLEDFGQTVVSGCDPTQVGHWFLPLALGVPAGAAGGYFYRKWQEEHPGKVIPWISGEDPSVGGPWVDIVGHDVGPSVGGPWVDIVGHDPVGAYPWASIHDLGPSRFVQRGPWVDIVGSERHQTHALIRSAIREVIASDRRGWEVPWSVAAYVWALNPDGTTSVSPSWSPDAALVFLRDLAYTRQPVAIALFDKTSAHWPNPVSWTKSPDPAYEGVIAQQIARHTSPRTAGVGAGPWLTIVGEALDVLRRQAKIAADELPGRVIGAVRDGDNRWQLKQFHSADDADDWFGHVTRRPTTFTYAAYFDKDDVLYPNPLNEKIGGARSPALPGPSIPRGIAEVSS